GLEPPPPGFCEDELNRLSIICEERLRERPEEQEPTPSPDARALPLLPARSTRPAPPRLPTPRPTATPSAWTLTGWITYRDPQGPEGARLLTGVRVEIWDQAIPQRMPPASPTPLGSAPLASAPKRYTLDNSLQSP
ncbi:MAG: hypothetical protein RQ897_15880, partial [Thermoflexus sp.]